MVSTLINKKFAILIALISIAATPTIGYTQDHHKDTGKDGWITYRKASEMCENCGLVRAIPATLAPASDSGELCITNPYSEVYFDGKRPRYGVMLPAVVGPVSETFGVDRPVIVFVETALDAEGKVPEIVQGNFCVARQLTGIGTLKSVQPADFSRSNKVMRGALGGLLRNPFGSEVDERVDVIISSTPGGASIVVGGMSYVQTDNSVNVTENVLPRIRVVLKNKSKMLKECRSKPNPVGRIALAYHCVFD